MKVQVDLLGYHASFVWVAKKLIIRTKAWEDFGKIRNIDSSMESREYIFVRR